MVLAKKTAKVVPSSKSRSYVSSDHDVVKKVFRERNPKEEYIVELDPEIKWSNLLHAKSSRRKLRIAELTTLPSNIPHFNIGTILDRGRVKRQERTGLFLVKLANGSEVIILKRLVGYGKHTHIYTLYCTSPETEKLFLKMFQQQRKAQMRPKLGAYMVNTDGHGILQYSKFKMPNPPVIHQDAEKVQKSIDMFFANPERYLRNGKSGAKRILLYGIAGGGKTTLAYQIARKYMETHCVVFAMDIGSIAAHTANCAKYQVPTIVFAEECDKWMEGESSSLMGGNRSITAPVKAFLDGHLSARNTAGEMSILITNYPEKIERTILLRPGRIHERIEIGPLDEAHAFEVAKLYFKDKDGKLVCEEKALEYFKNHGHRYTGAQIENIAGMVIDYVNGTDLVITDELIGKVVEDFKIAVQNVRKYKDKKTIIDEEAETVGFTKSGGDEF